MLKNLSGMYSAEGGLPNWKNTSIDYYTNTWRPYIIESFSQNFVDTLSATDYDLWPSAVPNTDILASNAALAPDGKIYVCPYGPMNDVFTRIVPGDPPVVETFGSISSPVSENYGSIVLAPDGNLYCVPAKKTDVLKIVPGDVPVVTSHGSITETSNIQYRSAAVATDGNIYAFSYDKATKSILKIVPGDPPTISEVNVYHGTYPFMEVRSTIPSPTTDQFYGPAFGDTTSNTDFYGVLKYDISLDSVSKTLYSTPDSLRYARITCSVHDHVNQRLVAIKGINANSAHDLLILNHSNTSAGIYNYLLTEAGTGTTYIRWNGCCILPDGKFLAPIYAGSLFSSMVINPHGGSNSYTYSLIGDSVLGTTNSKFSCAVLAPDGAVYAIPFNAAYGIRRFVPSGSSNIGYTFPLEALLSPWLKGY